PSASRIGTVVQAPSSNGLKTWPRQHALWFWTVTAIPPTHSGGFRTSRYIGHLRCRLREGGGRTGARATPPDRTARRDPLPEESKNTRSVWVPAHRRDPPRSEERRVGKEGSGGGEWVQ